jgi:hypothetical protein
MMGLIQAFNVLEQVQKDNPKLNLNRALGLAAAQMNDIFAEFTEEEVVALTEKSMIELYENVEASSEFKSR